MKIHKIVIVILFFLSMNAYAINIEESIKSTIESNPKVKIAFEKLNESKEILIYSKGLKLPTVTSSISGTYKNADTVTATTSSTPETFTDAYKLTVTQNIYDSGYNNLEIERSKILFNSEIINFKKTIQNLILQAIDGYLIVINYEKSLEATKKNYDSILKAFEETKTRYDLGSATLYDIQNSEASFATAKTNLFSANQNLKISKKSFKRIVGISANNLVDKIIIDQSINLENILKNALANNLDLLEISNETKNKEILFLKEKKSKMPSLDFSGTVLHSNGDRIEKGTETTSGSVSLTLTIPLFKKGQDNSNIRKYQSQMLQSEINYEDYSHDLHILISNEFKEFKVNESKMESNLIIIKSIETSLKSLNEEYIIGTKTITDLVEGEEKLLNANVNYLNSKKEFLLNYFTIKSLEGSLITIFEQYLPSTN